MVSGPNVRTSLERLLEDNRTRITLLERRLAILGGGGGGGDIPLGTTRTGELAGDYRGGGPAQVRIEGAAATGPYNWQTTYEPAGSRAVTVVWNGTTWEIAGQTEAWEGGGFAPMSFAAGVASPWMPYTWTPERSWNEHIGFTKLTSGLVVGSGLLTTSATTVANQTLYVLPESHRPEYHVIHWVECGDTARALGIRTNGEVYLRGGTTLAAGTYLNLDGVTFWANDSEATGNWTNVGSGGSSFGAAFGAYPDASYAPAGYYKDRFGFVWFRGLVRTNVIPTADNQPMIVLPATGNYRPDLGQHYRTAANDVFGFLGGSTDSGLDWKTGNSATAVGNWTTLYGVRMTTADSASTTRNLWRSPRYVNGWQRYNTSYPLLQFARRGDGLVVWRGLTNAGTVTATIATLNGFPEAVPRARRLIISTVSAAARARLDIMGDPEDSGRNPRDVTPLSGVSNAWVTFDNIHYLP